MQNTPNQTPGDDRVVSVREVGPRDGFQNEPETIATSDKISLINELGQTGLKRIEVASFVRPDVIPQLSDGIDVLRGLELPDDVERMVLIPNSKGLDNALKVRELFDAATLFVSASESHNKANINRTVRQTMDDVKAMGSRVVSEGIKFSAVIATSFGCPYEGKVPMDRVLDLAEEFAEAGATELGFGDTTGMANPAFVSRFFAEAIRRLPEVEITAHFHNTRGQGLANAYAALEAGLPILRIQLRRARRMPRTQGLDGQHRIGGPGQHVPRDGRRHRHRSGSTHRRRGAGAGGARSQADQPLDRGRARGLDGSTDGR